MRLRSVEERLSAIERVHLSSSFYAFINEQPDNAADFGEMAEIIHADQAIQRPGSEKGVMWSMTRYFKNGYLPYQPVSGGRDEDNASAKARFYALIV